MIIYFLLILITLLFWRLSLIYKDKTECFFMILCLLFTLVSAIRYNVGTDYDYTYLHLYNRIKVGYGTDHFEILFMLLNRLFLFYKMPAWSLISFCSLITIPLFFVFIKNNLDKKYWFLGVLLFILSTIYFASMNLVRQYLAISIILMSYKYLKNREIVKYILCIIFASLIHTTALIALINLISLIKSKYLNRIMIILYLISIVFIFVNVQNFFGIIEPFVPKRYNYIFQKDFFASRNIASVLKNIFPNILLIFCLLNRNKMEKKYKYFKIYLFNLFIQVLILNILYGFNVFIRISYFFDFSLIILIPTLYDYIKNNDIRLNFIKFKNNKKVFSSIFLLGTIFYYSILVTYCIFIKNGHGVMPYKTIFMIGK